MPNGIHSQPSDRGQIERAFTYHPPFGDQPAKYERLRAAAKELAFLIFATCPSGRERSLAMTKLEESVMWANAAVARGSPEAYGQLVGALDGEPLFSVDDHGVAATSGQQNAGGAT